jgi:hypothetical protein
MLYQKVIVVAVVSALTAFAPAYSQTVATNTNFTTGFFNTNDGWVRGDFVTGQNASDPAVQRWQGNDPENEISPGVFVGGTDVIQFVTGYTPFGSGSGSSSLIQGGVYAGIGYVPGTTNVQLWRSFTPDTSLESPTVSFFVEWSLAGSLDPTYPELDTFAFDLRNAANNTDLLSLQFTPGINIISNAYTLQAIATGAATDTLLDIPYSALNQMRVDITGSTYNLEYWRINSSTRAVITNLTLVTGGSLATSTSALDFATVGIDWELTSGDPNDPGSNFLVVNQMNVQTAGNVVPEPATWAVGALLLGGVAHRLMRRRGQSTKDCK